MSLFQALQRLLRLNLITLRAHPRNPNTASPAYDPNKRCAYHSASPGHDTNECWELRNKIQHLIDEGTVEFTQDGQVEFFYHSSKDHQLKWQAPRLRNFCPFECSSCVFFWPFKHLFMLNIVITLMHRLCLFWINIFVFTKCQLFSYYFHIFSDVNSL